MPWDDSRHALGVAAMDDTHREFVALVEAAVAATDAEFPALFAQLHAHTVRHFDDEARLMQSCRFAARSEHEGEHQRILGQLDFLAQRVRGGRLTMARAYVEGLPSWFAGHLATMDSALAGALKATDAVPA
ncbi:MAG: hemerythrin family protein [Rhodocyclales bacterium]|nr:hemerythrin family protein [Rhodocyclales bacterium]